MGGAGLKDILKPPILNLKQLGKVRPSGTPDRDSILWENKCIRLILSYYLARKFPVFPLSIARTKKMTPTITNGNRGMFSDRKTWNDGWVLLGQNRNRIWFPVSRPSSQFSSIHRPIHAPDTATLRWIPESTGSNLIPHQGQKEFQKFTSEDKSRGQVETSHITCKR